MNQSLLESAPPGLGGAARDAEDRKLQGIGEALDGGGTAAEADPAEKSGETADAAPTEPGSPSTERAD
jgi:hypothetical protein